MLSASPLSAKGQTKQG